MERLKATPLVTPSREFFPPSEAVGHARAEHVFNCVKTAMGMGDWICVLEPYSRRQANAQVGEFWFLRTPNAPNGIFRVQDGEVRIGYASDLIERPLDLVGTLAHELCHYLLATIPEPAPGGQETHELDTDLAVAFMGFGVFGANRAFEFAQHGDAFSQGWRSQRQGYLSEQTWSFALSLFLALRGEASPGKRWLKPSVADAVDKTLKYINKNQNILDDLRVVERRSS